MVMTRKEAISKGLLNYSTGKPCLKGHPPLRSTRTGACVHCNRLRGRKLREQINRSYIERQLGYIKVEYEIHSADKAILDELVEGIKAARRASILARG